MARTSLFSGAVAESEHKRICLADILFGKQREMFDSPAPRKAALCGRRGGKTWAVFAMLYEAAVAHPGAVCPYLALTGTSARRILWPVIREIVAKHKIPITLHNQELVAQLPNGASIQLLGADDPRKVERLRGGKYPAAAIDEAGSFPRKQLEYLVEDVIDPALLDYEGEQWLVGTPSPIPSGYFYDITTGLGAAKAWPTWSWTCLDNPHLPHAAQYLAKKLEDRGWTEQTATYQREWLGRWVRDDSALVYHYDPLINRAVDRLPSGVSYVVGIDLGSSADRPTTAFAVVAYSRTEERAWIVAAYSMCTSSPTQVATEIKQVVEEYNPESIVCDAGALGGGYVNEFRQRHGLSVKPAEKREKNANIELLNGDLRRGVLRVYPAQCSDLLAEWAVLPWSEDRTHVDDRTPDHVSDAALYAWRQAKHWALPKTSVDKTPDRAQTDEYAQWEHDQLVTRHLRRLQVDQDTPWYRRRGTRR